MTEQARNSGAKFEWSNITEQFEGHFKKAFTANKKAHFDNLPDDYRVVDGAKTKWCNLLLLDAIIYMIKNDQFNNSSRRAFNQHRVLYDCILEELKLIDQDAYDEIHEDKMSSMTKNGYPYVASGASLREKAEKYSYLTVNDLEYPWDCMDNFCVNLLDSPPSKAKTKYIAIVGMLSGHETLRKYNHNLKVIIQLVISKVLFVFNTNKPSNMTPTFTDHAHGRQSPNCVSPKENEDSDCLTSSESTRNNTRSNTPSERASRSAAAALAIHDTRSPTNKRSPTSRNSSSSAVKVENMVEFASVPVSSVVISPPVTSPTNNLHKRVQGVNKSTKKRPSLDQVNCLFPIVENNDSLVSPVAKYEACPGAHQLDSAHHARIAKNFQNNHSASGCAVTQNMHKFMSQGTTVFPNFPGQPIFIPAQGYRPEFYEPQSRDRSQPVTPTMCGLSLECNGTPTAASIPLHSSVNNVNNTLCGVFPFAPDASKGACLEAMQQESDLFDCDELRLTEDDYDLLLDCTYEDDFLSLAGTVDQCESPTAAMMNNNGSEQFVREDDMCAKKSKHLQLQTQHFFRPENDPNLALDEPMLPSPSYSHHGQVPVMSQMSMDPSHFFNMTPRLQSLCNLDPIYRTTSGPAALGGSHQQHCGHVSVGTHCASCTSLAFEPFGFAAHPPSLTNPAACYQQQQQQYSQQQMGGYPQQSYQPQAGNNAYRSRSDSLNTTAPATRRSSFDFVDQQQPLQGEWTFSSGTTSHSTSGNSSGNNTYHSHGHTPSQHHGHHGASLRCVSEDMDSVAHKLTDKFLITCGASPSETTISHGLLPHPNSAMQQQQQVPLGQQQQGYPYQWQ